MIHEILDQVCKSEEVDGDSYFAPRSTRFRVSLAGTVENLINDSDYYFKSRLKKRMP